MTTMVTDLAPYQRDVANCAGLQSFLLLHKFQDTSLAENLQEVFCFLKVSLGD